MSWNQPSVGVPAQSARRKSHVGLTLAIGVLVVAAGLGCLYCLMPAQVENQGDAARRRHSTIENNGGRKSSTTVRPSAPSRAPVARSEMPVQPVEMNSAPEESDAAIAERLSGKADLKTSSAADQMIMTLINHDQGSMMAPLPDNPVSEEEFDRSLKKEIVVRETDLSSVKAIKQALIDARKAVLELRNQGMSVNEILTEHREQFNFNLKTVSDAQNEAQAIYDSGDPDSAAEYVLKVNQALREMGLDEIELPKSREERDADEAEASAAAEEKLLADEAEKADLEKRVRAYKAKNAKRKSSNRKGVTK